MKRNFFFSLLLIALLVGPPSTVFPLEKVKLGTAIKVDLLLYLPVLTGEEKGFWKENGLDVEWVPFAGTAPQMRAVAAGAINIGLSPIDGPLAAAEKGLPVMIVAEEVPSAPFSLVVRADSPYRHPRDLNGARIGVTTLGATTHAFGRIMLRAHGLEKDVRFVGAGGSPAMVAGLKAGAFDAIVSSLRTVVPMKVRGMVLLIASAGDYLPRPWVDFVTFARKDFIRSKPDVVRRLLKALLQSTHFIRENPRWALDKIKGFQDYSEEEARLAYSDLHFTISGRLDRKAIENVRKVFIDYGVISENTPPVDELFTNDYLP